MKERGESRNANGGSEYIAIGAVRLSHKPHPRKVSRPQSGLPIAECHGHGPCLVQRTVPQSAQATERIARESGLGKGNLGGESRQIVCYLARICETNRLGLQLTPSGSCCLTVGEAILDVLAHWVLDVEV